MRRATLWLAAVCFFFAACAGAAGDEVLLSVRGAPPGGLAVGRVDLTAAAAWCKAGPIAPDRIQAVDAAGKPVPLQFVPDAEFDASKHVAGTAILRLSGAAPETVVRLRFEPPGTAPHVESPPWDGLVHTPSIEVRHDAKRHGGLPSSITFVGTGKKFEALRWGDRLHHRELGSFALAGDAKAAPERVAAGPLWTVVRVRARYAQAGKQPDTRPEAVYDWHYFHDRPLVYVAASIRQAKPFTWHETHFLELTTTGKDFLHWAGGEPVKQGEFTGTAKTFHFPDWGALVEGRDAVGMFRCGQALFYDHVQGGATYLQAHGDAAWREWGDTRLERSAWLWIGTADQPAEAVRQSARQMSREAGVTVLVAGVRERIEAARKETAAMPPEARRAAWWRVAAAEQLHEQGRFEEALAAAAGQAPAAWTVLSAGELGIIIERTADGVRLGALHDIAADRRLSAAEALPLFRLALRHAETKESVALAADAGWNAVEVSAGQGDPPAALTVHWRGPKAPRLGTVRVTARADLDPKASALRWTLAVEDVAAPWAVWDVVFPQVAVADLGLGAETLFPRAAGEVQRDAGRKAFRFRGRYPSGWTAMPLLAAYSPDRKTGLYVAVHDPWGSTKEVAAEGRAADGAVVLSFEHPAADMGVPGTGFRLEGQAVWQLLRGDWFDAAVIYRDWVRRHARWYPKLGPDGREDTPLWMRELPVWVMTGGGPAEVEKSVAEFAGWAGVPVAVHWYNWHQIPFDNDYPHYFPTKPGFAESVARLQQGGVSVMPYINGRLWDTRDKGTEDVEFTKVARAAASKNEQGEPYTEMYGSKETDSSRVALAAMCPTTPLWQGKVREIVLRLFGECGVKAVYIDQVAAAQPTLCFDRSHGHPLGGGRWWTEGYWQMLDAIRRDMPKDRMLTTECNAEPYTHVFDGYLTWHWQYDGQVPVFPAVYGGAIQMFGRAYRGGPTKDLAFRMKAGQQLVYGEQIGWFHPGVMNEKENAAFLKPLVKLRWDLRRYFYAGEMARPPKIVGQIPRVAADWQWSGEWPVTTDAVMAGAWRLPAEKKLVLLLVNVGDEPVTARAEFDAGEYGFAGPAVRVTRRAADGPGETFETPPRISREVTFPPRQAWAWEVTAP